MGQIQVEKNIGGIEGLCVITPTVHGDERGYFMETYNQKTWKKQDSISTLSRIINPCQQRACSVDFTSKKLSPV